MRIPAGIVILAFLAACASPTTSDAPSLEGRWRNTAGRILFSDGSSTGPMTACWIEFSKSQSITECVTSRGKDRIVYSFRMLGPGQYESEVVENRNFPQTVGTRVRTEFRFEGSTLHTTSHPPAPKGAAAKYPVRVDSTWARD